MVNVKRYVARTAREALARVKAELGADAVVLSNRAVEEGVEIVALPASAMGELNASVRAARQNASEAADAAAAASARRTSPPPATDDDFTVTLGQHLARLNREQKNQAAGAERVREETDRRAGSRNFDPPRVTPSPQTAAPGSLRKVPGARHEIPGLTPERQEPPAVRASAPQEVAPPPADRDAKVIALEAANAALMDELSSIKGLLERQLAGFAWSEIARNAPSRTQLMGELLEAGFSPQLTRTLTENLAGELSITEARKQVREGINRQLRAAATESDIIERGGVFALVGPTGVGKTTTTAKLAARCVVRHGADKLALITTDGYRIGAHEQLRIYGRILGVPVRIVRDAAELRQTLQELRNKHLVLIDTIGMSQRDKTLADQSAMLSAAGNVRRLLCLNATASGDTLEDVVRAYADTSLAGCIFTKVDEAAALAPALDVAARHALDVFYVANGQRVPEDLHLPNRTYLVHRALREIPANSPYKLDAAGAAMLMASRNRRSSDQSQRGAA